MDFCIIKALVGHTRNKTLQAVLTFSKSYQRTSNVPGKFILQESSRLINNGSRLNSHLAARFFSTQQILQEKTENLKRPEGMRGTGKHIQNQPTGSPVTWKNLAAACGVVSVLMAAYYYVKGKKDEIREKNRKGEIGKSKIGGTFDLIDQDGKPKKSADYYGKWVLLYFGFTHCPDICPDEMEKMSEVYDKLKEAKTNSKASYLGDVVPIMITVDPERDGVPQMKEYCKEFHPELIGLTGTPEKIMEACKAFRVYFSAGPRDDEDDYIVDHTIIIYLLDPEGQFVDYYGQTKTAEQIVTSVKLQMGKYNI